jgi:hypothetical protein
MKSIKWTNLNLYLLIDKLRSHKYLENLFSKKLGVKGKINIPNIKAVIGITIAAIT